MAKTIINTHTAARPLKPSMIFTAFATPVTTKIVNPIAKGIQGISMSTAFNVYATLEMKGWIEAKSKSGYYVRIIPRYNPKVPKIIKPQDPSDVDIDQMISEVLGCLGEKNFINLSIKAAAS